MNEINVRAIKYGDWYVLLSIFSLCTSKFHIREIMFWGCLRFVIVVFPDHFVNGFAVISIQVKINLKKWVFPNFFPGVNET